MEFTMKMYYWIDYLVVIVWLMLEIQLVWAVQWMTKLERNFSK